MIYRTINNTSKVMIQVQTVLVPTSCSNNVIKKTLFTGRGRPKLTWDESVKIDLKDWNISKEIALDRSAWRLAINVSEL